jgi:hypothetical protein
VLFKPSSNKKESIMSYGRNGSRKREQKGDPRQESAMKSAFAKADADKTTNTTTATTSPVVIHKKDDGEKIICANPDCKTSKRIMSEGKPWGVMTLIDGTVGGVCSPECDEAYIRYKNANLHEQFRTKKERPTCFSQAPMIRQAA